MKTKTIELYQIDEHPEPEKVYSWIKANWHDLNQHDLEEMIDTLKAIAKELGGEIDYCICQVEDRAEFINFKNCHLEIDHARYKELIEKSENCAFTGGNNDCVLKIVADACGSMSSDSDKRVFLKELGQRALQLVHDQTEYVYSDEGLKELCQLNEYYFQITGEIE